MTAELAVDVCTSREGSYAYQNRSFGYAFSVYGRFSLGWGAITGIRDSQQTPRPPRISKTMRVRT
jgi:hypothetical protein